MTPQTPARVAHSTHRVAVGRASKRAAGMLRPQSTHRPSSPCARRASAASISASSRSAAERKPASRPHSDESVTPSGSCSSSALSELRSARSPPISASRRSARASASALRCASWAWRSSCSASGERESGASGAGLGIRTTVPSAAPHRDASRRTAVVGRRGRELSIPPARPAFPRKDGLRARFDASRFPGGDGILEVLRAAGRPRPAGDADPPKAPAPGPLLVPTPRGTRGGLIRVAQSRRSRPPTRSSAPPRDSLDPAATPSAHGAVDNRTGASAAVATVRP